MSEGKIITYGKKAVTIQNKDKEQFYAPFEELEEIILPFLKYPFNPICVTYDIDYSNYSGEIMKKKRYYANNVKLINKIII